MTNINQNPNNVSDRIRGRQNYTGNGPEVIIERNNKKRRPNNNFSHAGKVSGPILNKFSGRRGIICGGQNGRWVYRPIAYDQVIQSHISTVLGEPTVSNSFDPLVIEVEAIYNKVMSEKGTENMEELNNTGGDTERISDGLIGNWQNLVEENFEGNLVKADTYNTVGEYIKGNLLEADMYNTVVEDMNNIQGGYSDNDFEEALTDFHVQLNNEKEIELETAQEILMLP